MGFWASIEGRVMPAEQARISVLDNGFTLGDAVYETLRTYSGRPFRLDLHLVRLRASAARIGVRIPPSDAELADRIDAVLARVAPSEAYLRIIVTRGLGDVSYDFDRVRGPTVVILGRPFQKPAPASYERGVAVAIVAVRRNPADAADPAIKSCSLLNSVLAIREAHARGAVEAILLNSRGELAEGASSTVFAVRGGVLRTPPLDAGILPGITRQIVIDLGRAARIEVREDALSPDDFRAADEAFITSSVREVMPIATVDDRPVGDGRPGPITLRLLSGLRDYATRLCG